MVEGPNRTGLDYSIEAHDKFSANLDKFIEKISQSRAAFAGLKSEIQAGGAAAGANAAVDAQNRLAQAVEKTTAARKKGLTEEERAEKIRQRAIRLAADKFESGSNSIGAQIKRREAALKKAEDDRAKRSDNDAKKDADRARKSATEILRIEREALQKLATLREAHQNKTGGTQARQAKKDADRAKADLADRLNAEKSGLQKLAALREKSQNALGTSAFKVQQADVQKLRQAEIALAQLAEKEQNKVGGAQFRKQQAAQAKREAEEARRQARLLREELTHGESAANRFLFTFRRLVGVFAVFAAIRLAVREFNNAVRAGINFNRTVEDATLGIQSLLAATGTLATAQGRVTSGAEKFVLAQREARRQVELLQKDAVKTSATFEQLVETFQTALAPGLRAGLTPDQIRQFAIKISQGAQAINLPQNQLAEEIRSLLQGTIQARTTRLATALGITNEDIRRAKELGKLSEFLQEKFSAFEFAAEQGANRLTILFSNLDKTMRLILGAGAFDFFNEIKVQVAEIVSSLQSVGPDGIIVNPEAVRIARAVFNILSAVLRTARDITSGFSLRQAAETAEDISETLSTIVTLTGSFVKGIIQGFRAGFTFASNMFKAVRDTVAATKAFPFDQFKASAQAFGALAGLALAFKGSILLVVIPATILFRIFVSVVRSVREIVGWARILVSLFASAATQSAVLAGPWLVLAGVIAAVVSLLNSSFIRSIEIGGVRIGAIVDLFTNDLTDAAEGFFARIEKGWIAFEFLGTKAVRSFINGTKSDFLDLQKGILSIPAAFGNEAALEAFGKLVVEQQNLKKTNEEQSNAELDKAAKKIVAIDAQIKKNKELRDERAKAEVLRPGISLEEALDKARTSLLEFLGVNIKVSDEIKEQEEGAKRFADVFADFPVIVGRTREELEQQGKILEDLREQASLVREELDFEVAAAGIEGFARDALSLFRESATELRKSTKEFTVQLQQAQATLQGLAKTEQEIRQEIEKTGKIRQEDATRLANLGQALADLESKRAGFLLEEKVQTAQLVEFQAKGNKKELDALNDRIAKRKEEEKILAGQKDLIVGESETILDRLNLEKGARNEILDLVKRLAETLGNQALQTETIAQINKDTAALAGKISEIEIQKLQKLLPQELKRLEISRARLRVELENLRLATAVAQLPQAGAQNDFLRELAAVAEKLRLEKLTSDELLKQKQAKIDAAKIQLERVRGTAAEADVAKQITQETEEFNLQLQGSVARAQALFIELDKVNKKLEEPVQAGFNQALEDFVNNANDAFTRTRRIMEEVLGGGIRTIGDIWVDAIDPTKKLDLLSRVREFISSISRIVIEELAKIALVKALLEPLGFGSGGTGAAQAAAATAITAAASAAASAALAAAQAAQAATLVTGAAVIRAGGGGVFGFAEGGHITTRTANTAWPSPAHAHAPGHAAGGRPAGLHPSDTVPIWAAVGEFVQSVGAVRKYGLGFMSALNEGRFDPSALRSMTGVRSAETHRQAVRVGFASGGQIGPKDGQRTGSADQRPITIINLSSREELLAELASRTGQEIQVNVIRANRHKLARP